MVSTEVIVIGAGPIGLELAVALKKAGMNYLQFDAGQIGQTIYWFPQQTQFFSSNERIAIAGVPLQTPDQSKATREQYLTYLRSVVQQYDLDIRTYEPVIGIDRRGEGFEVITRPAHGEQRYRCRKLILATGGTAREKRLDVPGEDLPHVSHFFDDPHKYFRKRVLIVGGKNSAVEAAIRCHRAGAYVSLSYRRAELHPKSIKYWLLPEINGLMREGAITPHFSTAVTAISPTHVTLARSLVGEDGACSLATDEPPMQVPADFVLLMVGYIADMTLCKLAGVELKGELQKPTYDECTMETNVPGIYLAGTVTGGTQDKYTVFIENGHIHVDRILASLRGQRPPEHETRYAQQES